MSTQTTTTQTMNTQTNHLFKIQEYFIENKVQTGREESQSFKNAREFFYKKYIKTSYKINDDNTGYIIFSSANPARANMSDMYVREANGLILEINTWNVVVYPHQSVCKYNINTDVANKFLAKGFYKIYKLYDGTKVNLYFDRHTPTTPIVTSSNILNLSSNTTHIDLTTSDTHDNTEIKLYDIRDDTTSTINITAQVPETKSTVISPPMGTWTMSTTNGLAMNDIVWNGMTYQQALTEVLQKYQLNWESFTSELDRNCSYTFSFKHPVYHPFREGRSTDIYRLLFLKAVDTTTGKDVELSPAIKVDLQEEVFVDNMKILYNHAYNSYDNFIKEMTYRGQSNSQGNSQTEMKFMMPCYGYIIRSNQPNETFPEHDLFIESRLMQKIRKFMYETEYNKIPDKMELICLHNYLSPMNISEFISLFPQFNDKYQRYKQFFGQLLKEMLDQDMNNPQKLKSNQKGQKKQDTTGTTSVVVSDGSDGSSVYTIKQLATFLLSQLQSLLNTDTLGKNKTTYYKNFILHPKFVYSYYNVMKTTV